MFAAGLWRKFNRFKFKQNIIQPIIINIMCHYHYRQWLHVSKFQTSKYVCSRSKFHCLYAFAKCLNYASSLQSSPVQSIGSRRAWSSDSLLGANNAGQLFSTGERITWQRSTLHVHWVQNWIPTSPTTCTAVCNFRSLVYANGNAALPAIVGEFACQISRVFFGPARWTVHSRWNHYRSGTTWHIANCTRRRLHAQCITAVVLSGEDVVYVISGIQAVWCTPDRSSRRLMSIEDSVPLWIAVQTQEVGGASALVVDRPCCMSFEQQ